MTKTTSWLDEWEAKQMRDPEFRAAIEELEPAYQVARLRMKRGLTQKQLAKLIGTTQSSVARLESGRTQPRLSFLRKVVEALGGRLEIRIEAQEEARVSRRPSLSVASIVEKEWAYSVQVALVEATSGSSPAQSYRLGSEIEPRNIYVSS